MEDYDFNKNQEEEEIITTKDLEEKLKDIDDKLYENLKEKIESTKYNQIELNKKLQSKME